MKAKLHISSKNYSLSVHKEFVHDDLFEDDELLVYVRGNGYWVEPTRWLNSKEIASLFREKKLDLDLIDGTFFIIIQNKKNSELELITDHLNFFPLYFRKKNKGLLISDSLEPFKTSELDELGTIEMVSMGNVLGERTILKDVFKLPAASVVQVNTTGEFGTRKYWQCHIVQTSEEEFKKVFSATVNLIPKLSKTPSLTLTAGLDSRMVLSQLLKDNIKVDSFTFGHPRSADMKIAARIAKKLEIPHTGYQINTVNHEFLESLDDLLLENQVYLDGMVNSFKAMHTNYCFAKEVANHDMVITATGELVYSHYAEVPTLKKKDNSSIESIADFLIDFNIENGVTTEDSLKKVKEHLNSILDTFHFETNQNYYDAYYLEKLTALTSYLQQIISAKARVFNPIFSKKMIAYSLGLPAKSRKKRNFQRRLIVQNQPVLNRFLVNGFKMVRPTFKTLILSKVKYGIRLMKKLINSLLRKEIFTISYIQYSQIIPRNEHIKKVVEKKVSDNRLATIREEKLLKSNWNLTSLDHWLNKSREETEKSH